MIGGIVLVVLIALYMKNRNARRANEYELTTYPSAKLPDGQAPSDGQNNQDVQNLIGGLYSDLNKQLEAQSKSNQETAAQFASSLASTQTAFVQMFGSLQGQILDTNATIQKNMLDYAEQENTLFSGFVSFEPVDAKDGQTNRFEKVFGFGGIDYDTSTAEQKQRIGQHEERLKTDSGFVKSEIERAKAVIKNREAAGLDTSEQQKYLDRIAG